MILPFKSVEMARVEHQSEENHCTYSYLTTATYSRVIQAIYYALISQYEMASCDAMLHGNMCSVVGRTVRFISERTGVCIHPTLFHSGGNVVHSVSVHSAV